MSKSKKILIFVIGIITILTICFLARGVLSVNYAGNGYINSFDFSTWTLGKTLGINAFDLDDGRGNTYANGFQMRENLKFFCTEVSQQFRSGPVQLKAIVNINGDQASGTRLGQNGQTITLNPKNDDNSKKANKILSEIIAQAEENEDERSRHAAESNDISIGRDVYQHVMWKYLSTWNGAAFEKGANLDGLIMAGTSYDSEYESFKQEEKEAEQILKQIEASVSNGNNTAVKPQIQNPNKKESLDIVAVIGDNIILGPFTYNYSGKVTEFKYYFNDDKNTQKTATVGEYSKVNGVSTFTPKNISDLPNGTNGRSFYIQIPRAELDGKTKIGLFTKVVGDEQQVTTLYFLERDGEYQNLVYVNRDKKPAEAQLEESYTLNLTGKVSISKQDEDGKPLAGISFEIKDSNNNRVATLKTDSNGKTNEVELQINKVYQIVETSADIYGYKKHSFTQENISIKNGTVLEVKNGAANFKITEDGAVITIKNQRELATVQIVKDGADGDVLSGVPFVIEIHTKINVDHYKYLRLTDANGNFVSSVTGEVTINENNTATINANGTTEYKVEYVSFTNDDGEYRRYNTLKQEDLNTITKFVTNDQSKITIKNLEINANISKTYDYTAYEMYNPHYGYGSGNNSVLKGTATNLEPNKTTTIKITNRKDLGNLLVEKFDEDNNTILLPGVGFVVEISPSADKKYAYLALYDESGKLVNEVNGNVKINSNNKANDANGEYRVQYVTFNNEYSKLTNSEKAQLTTFITGEDGRLTIENLEVYAQSTGNKYTYKLIETSNSNYGYVASSEVVGSVSIESNTTTKLEIGNKQKYTKLSGYVWLENPGGKSNEYDCIYDPTVSNEIKDIKLTDLYIMHNGVLQQDPNAQIPVKIELRDKNGKVIKAQPDEFDETGKYTFNEIETEKLSDYKVVFVYDGFYYTTVSTNLELENGSKVEEVANERKTLNEKFGTIEQDGKVVSTNGTENTVEYTSENHTATVSKFNFDTTLSADTNKLNFAEMYRAQKQDANGVFNGLDNINMGLVIREQPDLALSEDIEKVEISFNGYNYSYIYATRNQYLENNSGFDVGVKFENKYATARYTRTIYASDIQAAADSGKEIGVSITYKITIKNQSRTLSIEPKTIINYFDNRYEQIESIVAKSGTAVNIDGTGIYNDIYNVATIAYGGRIEPGNSDDIEIKFKLNRAAILDLLNETSTYHNMSEILSYSTYYGNNTNKMDGKAFTTDVTAAGSIYAGIDEDSAPGNAELKLVDHPSGGTQVIDTTDFEDDTSSAPSLILEAGEERKISGTVWEDRDANTEDDERLGDGIYDNTEYPIAKVKLELWQVNSDGTTEIAKYSNGEEARTETSETGEYTFGYEQDGKHIGILPGTYFIKYIYNNESYIITPDGNKNLNANDYKSTIITSDVIKSAINNAETITYNGIEYPGFRWYLIEEPYRYSDAVDNMETRNSLTNEKVTYGTYKDTSTASMDANTPIMDVGIEFTTEDSSTAAYYDENQELQSTTFVTNFAKVDFGIIERAKIDITPEKQITSLEIIGQNGASIIPKGNPSNPGEEMQYVKTGLEDLVSVEIDTNLLQGSKLELEYTVTLTNNSETDYTETEYYYYGTGGRTERRVNVEKLIDYLDTTITLDSNKQTENSAWTQITDIKGQLYDTGLISEDVYNELKTGNYIVLLTEEFKDVPLKGEKSLKLYASKYLATSLENRIENDVEIIELSGGRTITSSIPGDYVPHTSPNEQNDWDQEVLVITAPTGIAIGYEIYIIAIVITLAILVAGIVIIKKKVIKK